MKDKINATWIDDANMFSGHFNKVDDYRVQRPKGSQDWLIFYTLSGEGILMESNGSYKHCSKGDIAIYPQEVSQHYYTAPQSIWNFYWVHVEALDHYLPALTTYRRKQKLFFQSITSPTRQLLFIQAFHRLIAYNRIHTESSQKLAINALEEVCLLIESNKEEIAYVSRDPRIEEVFQLILSNFQQPLTVEALAQKVALSPSRLAHLFKEETGLSILQFLIKTRLEHAKRLLSHLDLPIQHIAYECGFHSPYYFTKQFKQLFGITPSVYKKNKEKL
jgi:AraC family transcriptional regulator of arabinose operon